MILVDSNIVVNGLNASAGAHKVSRTLLDAAMVRTLPGVLVPQILLEAYAIVTDSRRVDRPLDAKQAWWEIETLAQAMPVITPEPAALWEFGRVVRDHGTVAQEAFDAFLVAQMRAAGIGTICTLDAKGFVRYRGITAEAPESVLRRFGIIS